MGRTKSIQLIVDRVTFSRILTKLLYLMHKYSNESAPLFPNMKEYSIRDSIRKCHEPYKAVISQLLLFYTYMTNNTCIYT